MRADAGNNEGTRTIADGVDSHAEGYDTKAAWTATHAEGHSSTASSTAAHAEGQSTLANGAAAHAEGNGTTASGANSHAEGIGTTASADAAHAEGNGSKAISTAAHAEGVRTYAGGGQSHAEGYQTQATDFASHAEGSDTAATRAHTHAEGHQSHAERHAQFAKASGQFTTIGDAQIGNMVLRRITTDATAAFLSADAVNLGDANSGWRVLTLPASRAFQLKISTVARRTDVQGEMAGFTWEGLVGRDATGNARIIGTPVQAAWGDAPATDTWSAAVSINTATADNYVAVTVTGQAAKTIRWVAKMEWVEVAG